MPHDLLDIYPLAVAARIAGITYPGLTFLIDRDEVRVVQDRAGKRYLTTAEVERLRKRYAGRKPQAVVQTR